MNNEIYNSLNERIDVPSNFTYLHIVDEGDLFISIQNVWIYLVV